MLLIGEEKRPDFAILREGTQHES